MMLDHPMKYSLRYSLGLLFLLPSLLLPQPARAEWATVYAEYYNGLPTASGEPYSDDLLTAAHPDLPLGTYVRVSYGDAAVEVKINDRCHCDIDLSWSAAQALGLVDVGTVIVEVIESPQ
jgi:rare lipoprotein A